SLDFPMRSALPSPTDRHGISRLPLKVLACMLRVSDRAGSRGISRLRRLQSCLPLSSTASAPQSGHRWRDGGSISRLHTWPARTPVNASLAPLRTKMHDSESARVASPSLYESFIHNTLPALTGALNFEPGTLNKDKREPGMSLYEVQKLLFHVNREPKMFDRFLRERET